MYTQMYAQENPQRSPTAARPGGIIAVMLVLLLMSVGVAWWISHHRQAAGHRGNDILAEIRSAGLKHFWGEGGREFYLMRRNGENVGWQAVLRKPTRDGYGGLDIHAYVKNNIVAWETWTLSNDLREGYYVAMGPSILVPGLLATTKIVLKNGQVEVTETLHDLPRGPRTGRPTASQFGNQHQYTSRTAVPENYLPEGSLPLVMRLVGERKVKASFKIVLNETPPLQAGNGALKTRLGSVQAEFTKNDMFTTGPRPVPTTIVTTTRSGFGREMVERSYWSPAGELQQTVYDHSDLVSVTLQELLSVFPNAMRELDSLQKTADFDREEEKEDEEEPGATATSDK